MAPGDHDGGRGSSSTTNNQSTSNPLPITSPQHQQQQHRLSDSPPNQPSKLTGNLADNINTPNCVEVTTSSQLDSPSASSLCPNNCASQVAKISFETAIDKPASSWATRFNPFYWFPTWRPTSMNQLFQAESRMLRLVKANLDKFFVKICNDRYRIWTLVASNSAKSTSKNDGDGQENIPLVMVHGMGGGNGIWAMNIDELAKERTVYSFDVLGFGMSSRPKFSQNPAMVESEFVDSVESWRQAVKLKPPFILLGHSLGGYIAASYAIRHPSHVKHLILVDPWGVPEMPKDHELGRDWPVWVKALRVVLQPFNPLAAVRGAGPWGPALVKRFRPDFQRRYAEFFSDDDDTVFDYIYHLNAQTPSGEAAFKTLAAPYGFAKEPVIRKIDKLEATVPITFLYGAKSWISSDAGRQIQKMRSSSYVDVQEVIGAGHHVYADRPTQFNNAVNEVARFVDSHLDANLNATDCCVTPPADPATVGPGGDAANPSNLKTPAKNEHCPRFTLSEPDETPSIPDTPEK